MAAIRDVRGLGSTWPLYRIDRHGQPHDFGSLTALLGSRSLVVPSTSIEWLRDDFAGGVFPGVPWFLEDQRPQGFIGRGLAQHSSRDFGSTGNIELWSDDDVLAALVRSGERGIGNFVLGDGALDRAMRLRFGCISGASRTEFYGEVAAEALSRSGSGLWIAGEQPKFTTTVDDGDEHLRHVIVKFSEPVDNHPAARRWADLLICEHLASELLAEQGHDSARTDLVWSQGRLCLEVTRFDRVGAFGRRGCVTLAAWSDAHDGERDDWLSATLRMQQGGWVNNDTQQQVRQRWWFGRMIANTDMHFGNLSFFLDDTLPLRVTPSYDMLPILYRPASTGEVVARQFQPPAPTPSDLSYWTTAAAWAETYWQRVAERTEISDDFRQIAVANHSSVARARARFAQGDG